MELLGAFSDGIAQILSLKCLLGLVIGVGVGFFFGIIPGLQSITALVVVLPFTFGMDPIVAMYVFAGIIGAAGQGGLVTAIALGIPGTAQNAAAVLDGYALTQRGETSRALGIAAGAGILGASFGLVVLLLFIPIFVPFLMEFGPAERFWVISFGMVAMSVALPGNFLNGLIGILIGLALACIGFGGPTIAVPRLTFGTQYLLEGLDLVAVVIGFLVVTEAISFLLDKNVGKAAAAVPRLPANFRLQSGAFLKGMREPLNHVGTLLRSSAIGTLVGAVPGVGGTVAQFFSYNMAYAASRNKQEFGKGSVEGLVAAQAPVDAKEGGSLLPTLVFGMPGNGEMALVLAAWTIHGLQPGPFFLAQHADIAWALILGLLFANIIATVMVFGCTSLAAKLPRIRGDYVGIGVIVLAVLAQMSVRQNLWDAGTVLAIGMLGYLLGRAGIPVIGLVIGFVLGETMETDFYTALQSGRGSYGVFISSPLAASMAAITLAIILWMVWRGLKNRMKTAPKNVQRPGAAPLLFRLRSEGSLILIGVLALLAIALAEVAAPGYKGGPFVLLSVLLGMGCCGLGLLRNLLGRDATSDDFGQTASHGGWSTVATGLVVLVVLFTLVVVLGMYLGTAIAVLAFMAFYVRAGTKVALLAAAGWGLVVPALFQMVLGIELWPGVIAEIIPNVLGGGLLPIF
jgi:putative tricarboxylic transport membrane protein